MTRKKKSEDFGRNARWDTIIKMISEKNIATQKDLQDELAKEGFAVTQATLSRDIRDLRLVKVSENGQYRYQAPGTGKTGSEKVSAHFFNLIESSLVSIDHAQNLVVIHTYAGMASALCAAIDGFHWENVLGTLAGDDTILVVTRDNEAAADFAKMIRDM